LADGGGQVSLAFSHHSERALHGIDDKEKRKSRLREQRDELLEALKVLAARLPMFNGEGEDLDNALALIARIEGK
jgi:hypothetical protein